MVGVDAVLVIFAKLIVLSGWLSLAIVAAMIVGAGLLIWMFHEKGDGR